MCLKYARLKTVCTGQKAKTKCCRWSTCHLVALRYENSAKRLFKEFMLKLRSDMEHFVLNSRILCEQLSWWSSTLLWSKEPYSPSTSSHLAGIEVLEVIHKVKGILGEKAPFLWLAISTAGLLPFLANCSVTQQEILWFINMQGSMAVTLDSSR